jgi:hypothetical protein
MGNQGIEIKCKTVDRHRERFSPVSSEKMEKRAMQSHFENGTLAADNFLRALKNENPLVISDSLERQHLGT